MHCHSTASQVSKLGVQPALGLPECATPPEEVYKLAKQRGMDFVTITDHDTISGACELADRYQDAFVSEDLTAWFRDEPQAVHILCLGITPEDHEWLQAHARDVAEVSDYLHDREIACSLAHPFYAVEAPLEPRHRRRLAQLFGVWEVRNGSRARELNLPAATYIDTHGGAGTGGSDDHAGVDIGRTWTETPASGDWRAYLHHVRAGRTEARGEQGSAAKWAHSAMALAVRALGRGKETAPPEPASVLRMAERLMREGDARSGTIGADLRPGDARALLRAWLATVELDLSDGDLIAHMQSEEFSHAALFSRACRRHERKLAGAVDRVIDEVERGAEADLAGAAMQVFDACVAAIPYAPAAAFLGREKNKLVAREHDPLRVALVADGVGGMHGVTRTLEEIRERGVPGFEVEVIGTDANVDRRLSAVAEVDIPFYVTLLVIPAAGGRPFYDRSVVLHRWLLGCADRGDAIAQHGFVHHRLRRGGPHRRWQGGAATEFAGLRAEEARQRIDDGRRLLTRAGLEPHGFVAPGYAYTRALRRELRDAYRWFATIIRCWGTATGTRIAPALGLGTSTPLKRALSPPVLRAALPFASSTLRLDVHPADFSHAAHVRALEHTLDRARARQPVTYDELLAH